MAEYGITIHRVRDRDADGDRITESVLDTYVYDGSLMANSVLQLIAGLLEINIAIGLTVATDGHEATWTPRPDQALPPGDDTVPPEADGKPKRTRRTKAQIEADKLAADAEAARVAAGGQPTLQPVPAYVPGAVSAPVAQPVDAPAPAQPAYNPFGG
jgi:hypothetical protein